MSNIPTNRRQEESIYPTGCDKFDACTPLSEGYARAMKYYGKKERWFHVDEVGRPLYRRTFDFVSDFRNGFAIVGKNCGYNFISDDGQLVLSYECRDVRPANYDGHAWVCPLVTPIMPGVLKNDRWRKVSLLKYV